MLRTALLPDCCAVWLCWFNVWNILPAALTLVTNLWCCCQYSCVKEQFPLASVLGENNQKPLCGLVIIPASGRGSAVAPESLQEWLTASAQKSACHLHCLSCINFTVRAARGIPGNSKCVAASGVLKVGSGKKIPELRKGWEELALC